MTGRRAALVLAAAALLPAAVGSARSSQQTAAEQLPQLIDQLGDFDFAVRMEASRAVRRADPAVAGAALREAVRLHEDSYVQFRALVLLYGLDLPDTRDAFAEALESPNDRVRAAAYSYYEIEPAPAIAPRLLAALDTETSEFVRPALVRALAANDDEMAVREQLVRDIDRGETFFRAVVIEALGDHRAEYAVDALLPLAAAPGVLQDDALLALGKIGDRRAAGVIAQVHPLVDETLQPVMSAASCLLGTGCEVQVGYVGDALRYGAGAGTVGDDARQLLRNAASSLAALAVRDNRAALDVLLDVGMDADASARAPIALAVGTVALRRPEVVRAALEDPAAQEASLTLLREAFDMLDEDMAEERFYAYVRRAYWESAAGSAARAVAEATLQALEF